MLQGDLGRFEVAGRMVWRMRGASGIDFLSRNTWMILMLEGFLTNQCKGCDCTTEIRSLCLIMHLTRRNESKLWKAQNPRKTIGRLLI